MIHRGKQVIEGYFPDFMRFFFLIFMKKLIGIKSLYSWTMPWKKITRDAEIGRRYADKLVKVWLKTGGNGLGTHSY